MPWFGMPTYPILACHNISIFGILSAVRNPTDLFLTKPLCEVELPWSSSSLARDTQMLCARRLRCGRLNNTDSDSITIFYDLLWLAMSITTLKFYH
ncbi:hypothetical protein PISMIDRAFT_476669 [Pisolithus microcarpus 441]|uniref:Uncharacterized protein n=1 Tax=Pisolithus microcarpus 441 TaxID=765257 RepID=A0A0C9Z1D5_9AGAM|nr:hypothetical protein PISMIDRAFT_476669 [Pisolithus microcarpus 441]